MKALEAPDAEVPLPDRLKLHDVILDLWTADDPFARSCLLEVIATCPLTYGPWRALKRDLQGVRGEPRHRGVRGAGRPVRRGVRPARLPVDQLGSTLAYLVRRAWRFLRRVGVQLPATYADTAVDYLCRYPDDTNWRNTWIANHVFFHDAKQYGRSHFHYGWTSIRRRGTSRTGRSRTCGSAARGRCSRCWSGRRRTPCASSPRRR